MTHSGSASRCGSREIRHRRRIDSVAKTVDDSGVHGRSMIRPATVLIVHSFGPGFMGIPDAWRTPPHTHKGDLCRYESALGHLCRPPSPASVHTLHPRWSQGCNSKALSNRPRKPDIAGLPQSLPIFHSIPQHLVFDSDSGATA